MLSVCVRVYGMLFAYLFRPGSQHSTEQSAFCIFKQQNYDSTTLPKHTIAEYEGESSNAWYFSITY